MTEYRVGAAGATIFDEKGNPLATLRPGSVVVEGRLAVPGSPADTYKRGYDDKMIRPAEDKSL